MICSKVELHKGRDITNVKKLLKTAIYPYLMHNMSNLTINTYQLSKTTTSIKVDALEFQHRLGVIKEHKDFL